MRLSLQAKVTLLITVVVVATSSTGSYLFISAHKRSIEREIINRGITMSEALSRAVAEGLASENLQLIQQVESIVHTDDVKLAQVYSTIWLPVDAYPLEKFNEPADPAAIEYFKRGEHSFYKNNINLVDVYSPVFYRQFEQVKDRKYLIGYVRLMLTTEGIQQTIRKMLMMNILASVLLMVIAIVVLNAFVGKYLLTPILTLRESISKYREGSLPNVISVDTNDEIGELSREFNRMSIAVKEREEKFRTLFNESADAILLVDNYGKILDANDVALERYKYGRSEFVGMSVTQLNSPDDVNNVPARLERLREHGTAAFEALHMSKDGLVILTEVNARSVVIGGTPLIISTCRDITERKKAEEEIKRLNQHLLVRNENLEFANKELESFVYSVSHDLRGPLRAIFGFSEMMMRDIADKLDEKGKRYFSRILDGTEKMSCLIDDLLNLSRISRQEIQRKSIDLSDMASSIITDLRETHPGRSVEVDIKEGLTVFADPGLIEIVLSNLIGNAWKFTGKTEHARVEFGTIEQDGKIAYYVRDNGAGFDQKHAGKMFSPFHRLHSETEFKGTGIGLAIVDRVISRHGGKVWAEGIEGKGAAIYFTLT